MRSNRQVSGHHCISAAGNLRSYDIDGVVAINNPSQKTLTIVSYKSDQDFEAFMARHFDRLRGVGYTFILVPSARIPSGALSLIHALNHTPEKVRIICDAATREKRWVVEKEAENNPTGWETHKKGLNF